MQTLESSWADLTYLPGFVALLRLRNAFWLEAACYYIECSDWGCELRIDEVWQEVQRFRGDGGTQIASGVL